MKEETRKVVVLDCEDKIKLQQVIKDLKEIADTYQSPCKEMLQELSMETSNCSITMRKYRYIAEVLVLQNFHASFGGSKQMPQISLWEVVCFPVVLMSP